MIQVKEVSICSIHESILGEKVQAMAAFVFLDKEGAQSIGFGRIIYVCDDCVTLIAKNMVNLVA